MEDYTNKVGFSERTDVVIEPKLSTQWFLKMTELAKPALDAVMNDEVVFHPAKFKNLYRHWMENVKDWCISRQLWWGHRIPVYYLSDGSFVVAESDAQALEMAKTKTGNTNLTAADLRQDEDVLDTWASSWLWPITVFDGFNNQKEIDYYYPTNDLVTGHDIIFFWVARMVMAGYEFKGTYPFKNVYFTGMVRDKLGRKMSKSLGNSPDPLDLIEKFGADGVRVGMLLCSPAGGDLRFDESLPEQGRNFANKIWNAFRLVKNQQVDGTIPQPESAALAVEWFGHKLNETVETMNDHFEKYRISDALMTIYTVFWQEFSSWYLEIIKPGYQQPMDAKTYKASMHYFEELLKLIHPFMPFISEDLWQQIETRNNGASIMVSEWPKAGAYNKGLLEQFEQMKEVTTGIRNVRTEKNIAQKESIVLMAMANGDAYNQQFDAVLAKLNNLSTIDMVADKPEATVSFLVKTTEYFVPVGGFIDIEAELAKMREELAYQEGFLKSVMGKLNNERFVAGAPKPVLDKELQKKADAESKIESLKEGIARLSK
jgi:valyl-tRNA synthetase